MASSAPLISQSELDKLLQILALQHTLGQIAAHFSHEFSADRKFYAGTCIASLLHDQLLALPQRIVGYYLLANEFPSPVSRQSQFHADLLRLYESLISPAETAFLAHVLSPADSKYGHDQTPGAILRRPAELPSKPPVDPPHSRELLATTPTLQRLGVRPVVLLPDVPAQREGDFMTRTLSSAAFRHTQPDSIGTAAAMPAAPVTQAASLPRFTAQPSAELRPLASCEPSRPADDADVAAVLAALANLSTEDTPVPAAGPTADAASPVLPNGLLTPEFLRLVPPIMPLDPEELHWQMSAEPVPLLWDEALLYPDLASVSELLKEVSNTTLGMAKQTKFAQLMASMPWSVLTQAGFSPALLPAIVTHAPQVAVELVSKALDESGVEKGQLLETLVQMPVGVTSMEVVAVLSQRKTLPAEFVNMFVLNCISSCERQTAATEKTRQVKLVCVFLQTLIRHGSVQLSDIQVSMQAFCVEFSRIREAAALYRALRAYEEAKAKS